MSSQNIQTGHVFLGDFIDGSFHQDGALEHFSSKNPAQNNQVVLQAFSRTNAVDQAVHAAQSALSAWRRSGVEARAQALLKVAQKVPEYQEKIAQAITAEMGKPIAEARLEAGSIKEKIENTIKQLSHVLAQAAPGAPGEQRFHALGVVAVIGPFNFPVHLINTHIIPALITGNTIVAKPSELTPLAGQCYAELFESAGFPKGVFNLIHGLGKTGAELVNHADLSGIIFTGSYETGAKIRHTTFDQPYKKVCLELGGKNPAVVLDDADLEQATREILLGALLTTGQRCTATSRIIATKGIADQLKKKLVEAFKKIRPSNPTDLQCFMGPLASMQARDKFMSLLSQAKSQGAKILVESELLSGGAFVTPSIYEVSGKEAYLEEELFGPHLSFQVVADEEAAFEWASKNTYGLSASIFTARKEALERFYDQVKSGVINWNRSTNGASGLLPFGGVGKSGNWQPAGSEGPRLSTYPVSMMSLSLGQITSYPTLENQLKSSPLSRLERQHRLEEIAERFDFWLDILSNEVFLPWAQVKVKDGGFELTAEQLMKLAHDAGIHANLQGLSFDLYATHPIEEDEDRFLAFCVLLLETDPGRFLTRPERQINVPITDAMPRTKAFLERFYGGNFLPREKKPLVADLARSQGPFMKSVDEDPLQIIDAASQIASLPAGFRPDEVQRAYDDGSFDELITSCPNPGELGSEAFECFKDSMLAHVHPSLQYVSWTNGGAEANEKAFYLAKKFGKSGGKRILTFEGAFHGRTLLALYSTWNKSKRAVYQINGYESVFVKRPIPENPYEEPACPNNWQRNWVTPHLDREGLKGDQSDALLNEEVDCLIALEKEILAGDVLACVIEPYQCEGGDVSPTYRFFNGLRALTKAYGVPLIFDEVQSGFGLSGPIFWHQPFQLFDADGQTDAPDLVVGAKRAQVGYVISRWADDTQGPAHAASALRGAYHLKVLEQIQPLEKLLRQELKILAERWPRLVLKPRAFGDAFAFDLPTAEIANHMINQRFYQGYMLYIAGERTLRYRMNRSMKHREIKDVFQIIDRSLELILEQAGGLGDKLIERMSACKAPAWAPPTAIIKKEIEQLEAISLSEVLDVPGQADLFLKEYGELGDQYRVKGEAFVGLGRKPEISDIALLSQVDADLFEKQVGFSFTHFSADRLGSRIHTLTVELFDQYADAIDHLEKQTYEPARQADMQELRHQLTDCSAIALIAVDAEGLVGLSFSVPLEYETHTSGPDHDPHQGLHDSIYSLDLTVDARARGRGIGYRLRAASIKAALLTKDEKGLPRYAYLCGRNRVGASDHMWEINQKWGAYLVEELKAQYGEPTAKARYYRIPLRRYDRQVMPQTVASRALALQNQSSKDRQHWGIHQPTGISHPLLERAKRLGIFAEATITKLTVSNFITPAYARYTEALRMIAPPGCAHMYYTSCLDEMIDKSIRCLKHNRGNAQIAVSFEGAQIARNTAAARSLTDVDQHFPWPCLAHPSENIDQTIEALNALVAQHGADQIIGVYVETIQQKTGRVLTQEAWEALCQWRDQHNIPLVLSEVHTAFGRSGNGFWWLNGVKGEADLVLWWAGGQIGHIFARSSVFVSQPLTLVSTWDGDELSATRLLYQLYASKGVDHAPQISRLDAILTKAFPNHQIGGLGLFRTVHTDRASEIVAQLKSKNVQIQSQDHQLIFAPPVTISLAALDQFEALLLSVV
jgi:succinylglutamic semialdehyde dehydrogenase